MTGRDLRLTASPNSYGGKKMSIGFFPSLEVSHALPQVTAVPNGGADKGRTLPVTLDSRDAWAAILGVLGQDGAAHSPDTSISAPQGGRLVAPGFLIPEAEYAERFADLPLEQYRIRMRPEVFDVFVRFTGLVAGAPNLDVVSLTEPEE